MVVGILHVLISQPMPDAIISYLLNQFFIFYTMRLIITYSLTLVLFILAEASFEPE